MLFTALKENCVKDWKNINLSISALKKLQFKTLCLIESSLNTNQVITWALMFERVIAKHLVNRSGIT